jgi:two-component system chemotaxis response regulator CheB
MSPDQISQRHEVFVVGASAGGLRAVSALVAGLPDDFPGALLVVIHTASENPGMLAQILSRKTNIPVEMAEDGENIRPGRVYVARAGRHMVLNDGQVRLTLGPAENRNRPAVDPLFRSAARFYGSRAVGIVLTGYLDDGTAGLMSIKRAGGLAVVQDPDEAEAPSMPRSALTHVDVDYTISLGDMPALIDSLARQGTNHKADKDMDIRSKEPHRELDERKEGEPSAYVCPACKGTLWEVDEGELLTFRCRVGHAYSSDSMLEEQTDEVERALWASLRSLEENADFAARLARKAKQSNMPRSAEAYMQRYNVAKQNADVLRQVLSGRRSHPAVGATEQTQPLERDGDAA